jgi:glycosyltransferase involved in cell wall biosynthesis
MKILFYNDSSTFGGHEKNLIDGIYSILERTDFKIACVFYQENIRFTKSLNLISQKYKNRLINYPINYCSKTLQCIRTVILSSYIKLIEPIFKSYQPDIIVIVQGTIEISSAGLVVAKKNGYKTISFIPLAFHLHKVGVKFGIIRDFVNKYFYNLPDFFITISNSMKDQLILHGVSPNRIQVIYCGIDLDSYQYQDKQKSREKYGFKEHEYVIAIIGQIRFEQKGQDIFVDAFSRNINKLTEVKLLIVGDGCDQENLKRLVKEKDLNEKVKLISWQSDMSYIYSAIDMLVIPSHYEGLPLVMLESMYYNIPVIASSRDGMKEVLPEKWLFEIDNSDSLIETCLYVKNNENTKLIRNNQERVHKYFNTRRFGEELVSSIISIKDKFNE